MKVYFCLFWIDSEYKKGLLELRQTFNLREDKNGVPLELTCTKHINGLQTRHLQHSTECSGVNRQLTFFVSFQIILHNYQYTAMRTLPLSLYIRPIKNNIESIVFSIYNILGLIHMQINVDPAAYWNTSISWLGKTYLSIFFSNIGLEKTMGKRKR